MSAASNSDATAGYGPILQTALLDSLQYEHVKTNRWLLVLALAVPAYPWSATGHHVVALIAQQRLSPEVRERIDRLLFNVRAHDWRTCAVQAAVIVVVCLAAAYLPARRASQVDPIIALRNE